MGEGRASAQPAARIVIKLRARMRRRLRVSAAKLCKPVYVYPTPPTSADAGSAVPITIELAITVRASSAGNKFVLVGVPVDVNWPTNVILHTPMYPVNVTPPYAATPDDALWTALPDITHAAGDTVVVTVMASCAVTTAVPILNTTAAQKQRQRQPGRGRG